MVSKPRRGRLHPSSDTGDLLERFLVAAATTFLGIRIYLAATGYPQIGGHGLHIAHLLWGGVGMLIGLVLMLAFLGRDVRMVAAIIAGAGWGTFIDELGKFVTSDVNYFYQPAIALIYITFVLLYLLFRGLSRRLPTTPDQRLAQALELIQSGELHGYLPDERRKALTLLDGCDRDNPLVESLRMAVVQAGTRQGGYGLYRRTVQRMNGWYMRLRGSRAFVPLVLALIAIHGATVVLLLTSEIVRDPRYRPGHPDFGEMDLLKTLVSLGSGLLICVGLVRLRRSRLSAFEWMQRGVLVSLLVGQLLTFYTQQLLGLWGLMYHILLLATLDYAIQRERAEKDAGAAQTAAGDLSIVPA